MTTIMKLSKSLLFITVLTLLLSLESVAKKREITQYTVVNKPITYQNEPYRILRSFKRENKLFFLVVNEKTLTTELIDATSANYIERENKQTKYSRLIKKYSNPPYELQNYGLRSLESENIYLTLDLCPSSKKGYEDGFFKELIENYSINKATPVTLFVSSRWVHAHEKSFLELLHFQKEDKLDIIWGNHSQNHFYDPLAPLKKNFLLKKNTDIKEELLDVEKLLLSYGQIPSILMRFPGLVSNEKAVKIVRELGLIAVGSNAWLAKEEPINEGSIILLHGNKNEPYGIEKAKEALFSKQNYIIGNLLEDLE